VLGNFLKVTWHVSWDWGESVHRAQACHQNRPLQTQDVRAEDKSDIKGERTLNQIGSGI